MKKIIFLCIFLCFAGAYSYANVTSEIQKVQAPAGVPVSLGAGYSDKGFIGNIISRIFTTGGEIQNSYVLGLGNISGNYANTTPKWNGQSFVQSNISYSGNQFTVDGDINIRGDIYSNGILFELDDPLPSPINCSGSTQALGWNGSNWICNPIVRPPAPWTTGNWSSCSATCGGGTQTRSVSCSSPSGCSGSRPSSSRSCNTGACPPPPPQGTWNRGNWGTCSVSCGGGVQTRSVSCSSPSGCSGSRPSSSRSCNTQTCTPPQGTWNRGNWGTCSVSCGGGVQTRSVSCSSPSGCSGSRPSSSRSCNRQACSQPTGSWSTGSWGSCSVSCGSGVQTRSVTCNYSGGCTGSRPRSSRTCNRQSCPLPTGPWTVGRWSSCSASPSWGSWSSCSNTCGTGTQTRSCRNRGGVQTRNVTCNYAGGCTGTKPAVSRSCTRSCSGSNSRSCTNNNGCGGTWAVSRRIAGPGLDCARPEKWNTSGVPGRSCSPKGSTATFFGGAGQGCVFVGLTCR